MASFSPDIFGEKRVVGNNAIPVFWSDDVDETFEKVKQYGVEVLFAPEDLKFTDYPYRCFQCRDTEGNVIEIAKYQKQII